MKNSKFLNQILIGLFISAVIASCSRAKTKADPSEIPPPKQELHTKQPKVEKEDEHLEESIKVESSKELHDWCVKLSQELRSVHIDRCLSMPWRILANTDGGHSIPILDRKASVKVSGELHKKVFILGGIHGDELSAVSTVFRWLEFLEHTKKDSFLRGNDYVFIPLANPDGFFSSPRVRTNKAGVDLNRNFGTSEWKTKAMEFWRKKAGSDPRRFPGKSAASEIETQAIQKAIEDFSPDLVISVHAPYKLVDHDGPIDFPNIKCPLPVRTLGAYPGSLGTFAGIERNIPVVTPELPNAKQLPDLKSLDDLFLFIMKAKY